MPTFEDQHPHHSPPNPNPRNPNPNPNPNLNPNPSPTPKKRRASLSDAWFKDQQLKHTIFRMQQHLHFSDQPPSPRIAETLTLIGGDVDGNGKFDPFSLLSDECLCLILSKVPLSQHASNSLVCKRWCTVQGKLVRSVVALDWDFIESERLVCRFRELEEVNIVPACFKSRGSLGILFTSKVVSVRVGSGCVGESLIGGGGVLDLGMIDRGVRVIANGCPNLRRLVLVSGSDVGLGYLGEKCEILQELEVHCCKDMALRGITRFGNLQILKLIGSVEGLYDCGVTDIGLTILAQGCRRLVKLELFGCEGSYDGIKAIGHCCPMLEELTLCAHKMDGGWLSALSYCGNLKTLKVQSCLSIDSSPGPNEHLGSCPTLEELYLERCQLRDKDGTKALFLVCKSVREVSFRDCWGLEDDIFRFAAVCRRVKSLSLEGCSLLTTVGLDSVVHTWKDLQTLNVVSCNNVKDTEITPELATLFSVLKELKWRPGSKSLLASGLAGTGVGKKGGRFFNRV